MITIQNTQRLKNKTNTKTNQHQENKYPIKFGGGQFRINLSSQKKELDTQEILFKMFNILNHQVNTT